MILHGAQLQVALPYSNSIRLLTTTNALLAKNTIVCAVNVSTMMARHVHSIKLQ